MNYNLNENHKDAILEHIEGAKELIIDFSGSLERKDYTSEDAKYYIELELSVQIQRLEFLETQLKRLDKSIEFPCLMECDAPVGAKVKKLIITADTKDRYDQLISAGWYRILS